MTLPEFADVFRGWTNTPKVSAQDDVRTYDLRLFYHCRQVRSLLLFDAHSKPAADRARIEADAYCERSRRMLQAAMLDPFAAVPFRRAVKSWHMRTWSRWQIARARRSVKRAK